MDLPPLQFEEKKPKQSFWTRLLKLPRKSLAKDKLDDSFKRQSVLYSSFNVMQPSNQGSNVTSLDESENFVTLESSALMNVHKDAGILFLNKSSVGSGSERTFLCKDEDKHVQFVPTPQNKYYKVDVKSAPKKVEDKESLSKIISTKPPRPILRTDKGKKLSFSARSNDDSQSNKQTRLVNVTYVDGPEKRTPFLQRTSTKNPLVERKNGSFPELNVSGIDKYGSLPRNAKINEEQMKTSAEVSHCPQSANTVKPGFGWHRQSLRNVNRQSCYGISDPSRLFEGQKILQPNYHSSNQDIRYRLSFGAAMQKPLVANSSTSAPNSARECNNLAKSSTLIFNKKQGNPTASEKSLRCSESSSAINRSSKYQKNPHCQAPSAVIPNKAINEVGLPVMCAKKTESSISFSKKSRSVSPHYIPLCEAFSSKAKPSSNKSLSSNQCLITTGQSEKLAAKKQKSEFKNTECQNRSECNISNVNPQQLISDNRRYAIKSTMQTQKRKFMNKLCKYNSKQAEDGFSSMADDECSFNCSCPTCTTKLNRAYKKNALRNIFSQKKDKYFFTITESDIREECHVEEILDTREQNNIVVKADVHRAPSNTDLPSNKTWYECNDSLCKSPCEKEESALKPKDPVNFRTPDAKISDGLYENLSKLINSASKSNLRPQDVKRLLSTPISSPAHREIITTIMRTPKKLFPNADDEKNAKFNDSLKNLMSPQNTSQCLNDSIVLLQEIFQKLSQECKDLLQPSVSSTFSNSQTSSVSSNFVDSGNKYVSSLVKNLQSDNLDEAKFADLIGGIAQSIFSETKAREKRKRIPLSHSKSLPDLQNKTSVLNKAVHLANSLRDICNLQMKSDKSNALENASDKSPTSSSPPDEQELPDGWSKTPTTVSSNCSSTKLCNSDTSTEDSKCSEWESQLLENAIRLGMGLSPIQKTKKTPLYSSSPSKVTKYKSRDVLSGKGKLKLKLYYNSGLVTAYVIKAAKLNWPANRDLNCYVKVIMIPDEMKRVHWRTNVQKGQKVPIFNQKFSFELLTEDADKRLVFSLWHRDYTKQRSELIGCMSFSVKHVMDNTHNVDGWYRLLRENFGTQKHFAAHRRKNSCSLKQN